MMYLLVALGGAVGALFRFLMSGFIVATSGSWAVAFPQIGTVSVNIIGSFLIGVIGQSIGTVWSGHPELKCLLITGLLGGFTTFSSFSLETVNDLMSGNYLRATFNVVISVITCIVATIGGVQLVVALTR